MLHFLGIMNVRMHLMCYRCVVNARILIKLDFTKLFILDVDWSTKGVGAILSQHVGKNE
jgi:hypothetical protein